jgi:putative hemolysin
LSDSAPISAALERLIREHTHIALVRDDHHRVIGMITLEDIIEELMGEIEDEFDRLPAHSAATGTGWVVGGGISLSRLKELTGIDLSSDPPTQARNLSEWMTAHLGRPVCGGDVIERNSVRILVRKIRRKKVLEAMVTTSPPTNELPSRVSR